MKNKAELNVERGSLDKAAPLDEFEGPMFDSAMSNIQIYQSMQKLVNHKPQAASPKSKKGLTN